MIHPHSVGCVVACWLKRQREMLSYAAASWIGLGLVVWLAVGAGAAAADVEASRGDRRPNIVIILTDDQGWGDLSVHGNTNVHTPAIDSLAREGALFERFFVCPVCSPTRAEMLTGRYYPRCGVSGVSSGAERLNLDEETLPEVLQRAGYTTAAFGKWHNGSQYPYHPRGRGFDEYYGFTSGHWGDYFGPPLEHNGQVVRGQGFLPDDLTDHALEFIGAQRDRPFLCYLALNTPHSPMQVPDRFFDRLRAAPLALRAAEPQKEDLDFTRAALAMVENIDWNVGRVLARLDELNLSSETIVLYFSDNGPNSARWNGGMRGQKGSTDEGGVRSPLLVRWPGKIAGQTRIAPIAGAIDLLPTLADLAEIRYTPRKPLDGVSLKPLLTGQSPAWADREILSHWAGKTSVRSERFRLDAQGRLYDMPADPGQERDVAAQFPQEANRLKQVVAEWRRTVLPSPATGERPYPVGYREFPVTMLPARDGTATGQIERSAKAPNCSYFTNWKRRADEIRWDIDIATAGVYEAQVYHTCAAENVGVRLELAVGAHKAEGTVTVAHDPPLYGAEHDRVPRKGESLVKDFRPLTLSRLQLPAGRGTLVLRAVDQPGPGVVDVRGVVLALTAATGPVGLP